MEVKKEDCLLVYMYYVVSVEKDNIGHAWWICVNVELLMWYHDTWSSPQVNCWASDFEDMISILSIILEWVMCFVEFYMERFGCIYNENVYVWCCIDCKTKSCWIKYWKSMSKHYKCFYAPNGYVHYIDSPDALPKFIVLKTHIGPCLAKKKKKELSPVEHCSLCLEL